MGLGNCCCPESCYVIRKGQLAYSDDFFNAFSATGNYEVATSAPETKWHVLAGYSSTWEGVQYNTCESGSSGVPNNYIVFTGSGSLSLIYPDYFYWK